MVVGHADVRGPEKYNLALSERRAEAREELPGFAGHPRGQDRNPR